MLFAENLQDGDTEFRELAMPVRGGDDQGKGLGFSLLGQSHFGGHLEWRGTENPFCGLFLADHFPKRGGDLRLGKQSAGLGGRGFLLWHRFHGNHSFVSGEFWNPALPRTAFSAGAQGFRLRVFRLGNEHDIRQAGGQRLALPARLRGF